MKDWFKENKNNIKRWSLILLFVCLFVWGGVADATEVRLGLAVGYDNNSGTRYQEIMLTSTDRRWYGALTRIGGDDRHNYQYWRTTAGFRVNWRRDTNFSPFMRLGAAYFSEPPTDYISDDFAFDMSVGVRVWNILEIEFTQHNSTGGRSDNNEGLNAILAGITLPFGKSK